MQRSVHLLLALLIILALNGGSASAVAQADETLDLANIALPVQDLPEDGYQVLTGGYLSIDETSSLIAGPRNLDETSVAELIVDYGLSRAYVLDLVLPEDRAHQDSPILALLQTTVYLFEESSGASEFHDLLLNYANTAFVNEIEPAVDGAYTITLVGEGGDQLRTLVSDGNVVIEIVAMDATGAPDETEHILVVEATLERLDRIRATGESGLSPMALTLVPNENTANFAHSQQTGVHGLYRYRDGAVQPAIGELNGDGQAPAPGMTSLYLSGSSMRVGGGTGLISTWLGQFDSAESAATWFDIVADGSPAGSLLDPYFDAIVGESWSWQGVLGVYRVSGTMNGQNYSGNVEIRLVDDMVVAIGYRSIGSTLPDTNVTNRIMDHQLNCLEMQVVCPPFEMVQDAPPPQATPIVDNAELGSTEFGWSIPAPGGDWIVDEQFTDAGYERIGLRNGVSIFEFESVINHHGDPQQCVLDELHLLEEFEEHSVITVWEDAAGNTEGGNIGDQAWIVYRVEPLAEERADQEYVIRIDCFRLVPEGANLVMRHVAPVDFWDEEQEKASSLRNSIVLPESSEAHGKLTLSAHDRRTTMIYFHDIDQVA